MRLSIEIKRNKMLETRVVSGIKLRPLWRVLSSWVLSNMEGARARASTTKRSEDTGKDPGFENRMRIDYIARFTPKTRKQSRNLFSESSSMKAGKIMCTREELDLGITLNGGQSFRWVSLNNGSKYRGVFSGHVWTLSQDENNLLYTLHSSSIQDDSTCIKVLKKYLNLDISLRDNIEKWSSCDPHLKKSCRSVSGVRILDQEIVENLFSFICSSNNNIPRISSMVEKMCKHFGKKICTVDKQQYNDFPTVEALSKPKVEALLREEGFGYRAAYIAKTAKKLKTLGGTEWLLGLCKANGASYSKAREELMTLPGVGPKVADCICLMSLGHLEAIPVDTHIFQVARANYMPHLEKQKTVTPKIHEEVSKHLRELWGPLAGWAQAIVFCAKISGNEDNVSPNKKKLSEAMGAEGKSGSKKKQRKR